MTRITPRPLGTILKEIENGRPLDKALAEEAVSAVAADGQVTSDESRMLEPYATITSDYDSKQVQETEGWRKGTESGRALLSGLATDVQGLIYKERDQAIPRAGAIKVPGNQYAEAFFGTLDLFGAREFRNQVADYFRDHTEVTVPTTEAELARGARGSGLVDVIQSVDRLLKSYPKATIGNGTDSYRRPQPEVRDAIEKLKRDWVNGLLPDLPKLSDPLKALLDAKYSP